MARNQSLHNERQSLLRRVHGHYGNTLRDEEAGSVERDVETGRIRELRPRLQRRTLPAQGARRP